MTRPHRAGQNQDPKQRLLQVTALILAGWHIKPKGYVSWGLLHHVDVVLATHHLLVYHCPTQSEEAVSSPVEHEQTRIRILKADG